MQNWMEAIPYDPLPALRAATEDALSYLARRDLMDEAVGDVARLWHSAPVESILNQQREDGGWTYCDGDPTVRSPEDYDQIETYRQVGVLVEKYAMDRGHPAIVRAAEYLFGCQTEAGDFRGIYGNQYAPNYTGAIMEVLIKAGYADDPRLERGFAWLLATRQHNGGWALPVQTRGLHLDRECMAAPTVEPDTRRPSSYLMTGCVLRAFAAHPTYRHTPEARAAGAYLVSRIFKRGEYSGRQTVEFWQKFSYPFWFTDAVSALDSLAWLGFGADEHGIETAVRWLAGQQLPDGTFDVKTVKGGASTRLWVGLAICRVLRRLYGL